MPAAIRARGRRAIPPFHLRRVQRRRPFIGAARLQLMRIVAATAVHRERQHAPVAALPEESWAAGFTSGDEA